MKKVEFSKKVRDLGYKIQKDTNEEGLIIVDNGASDWKGHYVARLLEDEEYGVYYDYCVPFKKELYDVIYEFISTPIEKR